MPAQVPAEQLVHSRLPAPRGFKFLRPSRLRRNLEVVGTLGYWSEFESEVRRSSLLQTWDQHNLIYPPTVEHRNPSLEQYPCGENSKHFVQAQFEQNVGQVMTAVFDSLGENARLVNYRAPNIPCQCPKYPDLALTTLDDTLLAIGQVGAPQDLHLDLDILRVFDMRRGLARIASFMTRERLRFGFITDYNYTTFLKLDRDDTTGEWILWHSNPIAASTEYTDVPTLPNTPTTPSKNFHGKVSVRECFLFLGEKSSSALGETNGTHFDIITPPISNMIARYKKPRGNWRKMIPRTDLKYKYISDNEEESPPPGRPRHPAEAENYTLPIPSVYEVRDFYDLLLTGEQDNRP